MSFVSTHGAIFLLGFVVVPFWLLSGMTDYFCHRYSNIENTSGTRESLLHLLQFALVGLPLLAGLLFFANAFVLIAMLVFILLHHGAAYVDVRYANQTRVVTPFEQMVHSFLEVLPITAWLLLAASSFSAIVKLWPEERLEVGVRYSGFPVWYILAVIVGALLLGVLPYLDELRRCLHAARGRKVASRSPGERD